LTAVIFDCFDRQPALLNKLSTDPEQRTRPPEKRRKNQPENTKNIHSPEQLWTIRPEKGWSVNGFVPHNQVDSSISRSNWSYDDWNLSLSPFDKPGARVAQNQKQTNSSPLNR